jgi:colanic acid/amylovoran biosynthesis glycosyltransferase
MTAEKMENNSVTVLHSFHTWLPQTQTWMHGQMVALQRLGVDAHVICEHTENLGQFGVANIHCLGDEPKYRQIWNNGLRKLRLQRHLDYLVQVGRKTGAQVVHSHFGNVGWCNLDAVRKLGAKHVVRFYGHDVSKLLQQYPVFRKRYRQLFHEADLFLCEGLHMRRRIIALGCPEHKVKVQHLGVDVERISFRPRQWKLGEPLRVLIAASFREKKGIPYAVEAVGLLRKEIPIALTIIGDAGKDEASRVEKHKILVALERTGIKQDTRLLGYQSHARMLQEAYQHHIFLHPSLTAQDGDDEGGAPVCITEMLATGMPVVGTTHCDIPEVMGPALSHLLAPERDAQALLDRIQQLIAAPEEWTTLANIGRQRIVNEFNQATMGGDLLETYKNAVLGF